MISEALYDHLQADSGVTTLCSNIYPTSRPLRVDPPFIIYTLDDDRRDQLLSGEGTYRQAIMSIDCYSSTLVEAVNIADAVETSLTGYQGIMGTTTPNVDVNHVRLERRGPHLRENDTDLHRVPLEFLIGYEV